MNGQENRVICYKTARSCFEAMYGTKARTIRGFDSEGKPYRYSAFKFLSIIRRRGRWGFAEHYKKTIHVWIGKRATITDVISLLGHEIGHLQKPYSHKNKSKEEQKASRYSMIAVDAYTLVKRLRRIRF